MEEPNLSSGNEPSAEEVSKSIVDKALAGHREKEVTPEEPKEEGGTEKSEEPVAEEELKTADGEEEKEEPISLEKTSKYPEVTEDDYMENEDGTIDIKAKHIADDLEKIVNEDASIFLKIVNSKKGGKKAEVLAKALGFKEDGVRNSSKVAKDVISAYVKAYEDGNKEAMESIRDDHFPDALKYDDADLNYKLDSQEKASDKNDIAKGDISITEEDLENAINAFVVESDEYEKSDLKDNDEFMDAVSKYKTNPETGEPFTAKEVVDFVAKIKLSRKKAKQVQIGGSKAGKGDIDYETKTDTEKVSESITNKMRAKLSKKH